MAVGGDEAIPVEDRGHHLVVADEHQLLNGLDDVGASTWTCLPTSSSWRAQLAVDSALPMNDERNLTSFGVDIDNNFFDESADDALLQAHVGLGGVPRPRQIGTECPEVISVWLDLLLDLRPFNARFDLIHLLQSSVPATFELGDNEAVLGVDGVVLLAREPLRIPRRLQFQQQCIEEFAVAMALLRHRKHRGVDGAWLHHAQDFSRHGDIDRQPAERNALRLHVVETTAVAFIARDGRALARVADHHLAPAATTTQNAREQRGSLLWSAWAWLAAKTGTVVVKHLADPEELLPRDIAVVVLGNQHRPLIERLASDGLADSSVDDLLS